MDKFYPIFVAPLSEEDGGGFIGYAVDLRGCMSTGDTAEEAFAGTREAIKDWIEQATKLGRPVPEPGSAEPAKEREEIKQSIAALQGTIGKLMSSLKTISDQINEAQPTWPGLLGKLGKEAPEDILH